MKQAKHLFLMCLFSIIAIGATSSPIQANSDIYKIEYHLTIEPPFQEVKVTMTVSNYPAQSLSLWIDKTQPSPVDISGFTAISSEGEQINARDITCTGWECQVAKIDNGTHKNFTVSYSVRPGINQDNPSDIYQAGIINSQYLVFSGYSAIPLPNAHHPSQILITYSIPEDQGWKFYSTWQVTEAGLNPTQEGIDTYSYLQNSVFAAGKFYEYSENISGNATTILIPKTYPKSKADELASGLISIYHYQSEMFGTSVGNNFLTVVTGQEDRPSGRRIFPGEWSTSMSFESSPNGNNYYSSTHRSFHRWNGWLWGMDADPHWWGEGTATYYSIKIPAKLGLNKGEDFQYDFNKHLFASPKRKDRRSCFQQQ